MKYTAALRNFLAHHETHLPEIEFFNLKTETDRVLRAWIEKLKRINAGADRAMIVHEKIDQHNDENAHIPTTCQKGCGFCCHLEVEITSDDADRLADEVIALGISIDHEKLYRQATRVRMDEAWKKGAIPDNGCVMLDQQNSCRAYGARPTVCRKHMVVTPVTECSTLGGQPIPRLLPMSEIILSASISLVDQETGSLPKMLSAALQRKLRPVDVDASI